MRNQIFNGIKLVAAAMVFTVLNVNPVFASAKANVEVNTQSHIVVVKASMDQMVFVAAGNFLRSYHQQVISKLKDRVALNSEFNETLNLIGVSSDEIAFDYSREVNTFAIDFAE